MHLIIDIGNSRVKYYFEKNTYLSIETLLSTISAKAKYVHTEDRITVTTRENKRLNNKLKLTIIVISTVSTKNQAEINKIQDIISQNQDSIEIESVEIFDPQQSTTLKNTYPGIGADRVAKLIGALSLHPKSDIALMDFGTATVMSVANANFEFVTGFIGLGLEASLKALAENAVALPDLSKKINSFASRHCERGAAIAMTKTEKAILQGAYLAHLGLIDIWLREAKQKLPNAITVCTGGLAYLFKEKFDFHIEDGDLLKAFVIKTLSIPAQSL